MSNLTNRPIVPKGIPVMTSLRQSARGQNCTLRLPCCNHDPATTVLAHIRFFGWAGVAQKPADFLGVYACSDCHDAIDGRGNVEHWEFEDILRALGETLMIHYREGRIFKECK